VQIDIPALELIAPTGPRAYLKGATLNSDLQGGTDGLYTGTSHLQVGAAGIGVADARWGGSGLALERLALDLTQTRRARMLGLRLQAQADALRLGGQDYRAARIGLATQSLDGESLAQLITGLRTLSSNTRSQSLRGLIGATLVTSTLPRLLAAGPQLVLDPARFETADGPVRVQISIGTSSATAGSTNRGPRREGWLTSIAGQGEVDLPETVAVDWLRRANQEPAGDARQRLNHWLMEGWVSTRDGRIASAAQLVDGALTINGKSLSLFGAAAPGAR
jgi:uncharacterized protein YdgA (DUF945 family)